MEVHSMEDSSQMEQAIVAYCFGHPRNLASHTNHFEETVAEIRRDGHEIWCYGHTCGLIECDGRWYAWMRQFRDDGNLEGKVYEFHRVEDALQRIFEEITWIEPSERIRLVRQVFARRH